MDQIGPDQGSSQQINDKLSNTKKIESLGQLKSDEHAPLAQQPGTDSDIPAHLSHDPRTSAKRTDPFQFGQRFLEDTADVFEYNAWDHVNPDEDHLVYSEAQYAAQRAAPVSDFDRDRFNKNPEKWWDLFYKQKTSTFFKDRKWLVQEFPVLKELTQQQAGPRILLEVGAGAGNTAFPVVRLNDNPDLKVFAVDFSKKAVETMRNSEEYQNTNGCMTADVWDVAGETLPPGIEAGTVDVVIMIFIFSALNPSQWQKAVENIWHVLKPGGEVLFRDYGRGDLAQVRFKAGRWMQENFYVRGDGTRVYFFDKVELENIWAGATTGEEESGQSCKFTIENLDVDRRMLVNRQRRIKMYRCWMQGRFRKPEARLEHATVGADERTNT